MKLTYDEAVSNVEKIIVRGKFGKADVYITRHPEGRLLVKDFSRKGYWERNLVGRIVIGRELRAYSALAGIAGLPKEFQRLSPYALAVEYLDGRNWGEIVQGEIGVEVMHQLERIVDGLHRRGWVHLDLHRRTNVLLVDGNVYVVDLASAFHPGGVPLIGSVLTRLIGFFDRLSLIKFKRIYVPDVLTAEEKRWLTIRNFFMPTKW